MSALPTTQSSGPEMAAMEDGGVFDRMYRIAELMSSAKLVPEHLQGSVGDCFMVVQQAYRWQMDPFAVGQKTFLVSGKLGYEGQLVAAVVNSRAPITGRLNYEYNGSGDQRTVTVSGTLDGESQPRTLTLSIGDVKTGNKNWQQIPDQMLAYRGARDWARRHTPEVLLGVYTPDELEDMRGGPREVKASTSGASMQPAEATVSRPALPQYGDDEFAEKLEKLRSSVESGKRTADEALALVESRATLTENQRQQILDLGAEKETA